MRSAPKALDASREASKTQRVFFMLFSVTAHCRIDLGCPRLDTAHQVVNGAESLAFQKNGDLHATTAVMANNDDVPGGIELLAFHWDHVHRNVLRPGNLAKLEFPRFAHIHQERGGLVAVGQPGGEFGGANLFHQSAKPLSGRAPSSAGITVSKRLTVW